MLVYEQGTKRRGGALTVSHVFGEIVWLLSQSSNHNALKLAELNWLVMPAVLRKQFHLFRDGDKPVGVALWALTDDVGEAKIIEGEFRSALADEADWSSGTNLWLVELIAPFATIENQQAELMFADLLTGVFSGKSFKMMKLDSLTAKRLPNSIASDAGDRLVEYLRHREVK